MNRADRHTSRDLAGEARDHFFLPTDEGQSSLAWIILALVAGTFTMFNLSGNVWPADAQRQAPAPVAASATQAAATARTAPAAHGNAVLVAARTTPANDREHPASVEIVTKCIDDHGTSFSDRPCAPGAQAQHVMVDPNQNLAQGLPRGKIDFSAVHPHSATVKTASAEPGTLHRFQCEALQAKVHAIDDQARQPLTAPEQDRLASLRKEARDAQFRLKC